MKTVTRRHVLRGAGVALALPWLESLAPRRARGQAVSSPVRFVPIYFPLGTTVPFWMPSAPGAGDAWQLSPILEPLAPVKSAITVLGHVDQTVYGPTGVEPSNGPLTASYLTSARVQNASPGHSDGVNGVSLDQRYAQAILGATKIPSLQVGLSTLDSYCDGYPCACSRSISWSDPTTPLYKTVDPQAVFDEIVSGGVTTDPAVARARARRTSVLDFVLADATALQPRLGKTDRARLDQFLTATRDLEQRVASVPAAACTSVQRPTWSASVSAVPPDYSRDTHADVMVDLIVMALSCDVTRVVSFMLDDARSDFPYGFLTQRHFTATGSTPGTGTCGSPVGLANAGDTNDGWATITWWFVTKLARLCTQLAAVPDGGGASLLDNSVVWFGSPQQGEGRIQNLPLLYAGGGGGWLKTNRFIDFAPSQRPSNVYLTFLRFPFQLVDAKFGDSTAIVPEILA